MKQGTYQNIHRALANGHVSGSRGRSMCRCVRLKAFSTLRLDGIFSTRINLPRIQVTSSDETLEDGHLNINLMKTLGVKH